MADLTPYDTGARAQPTIWRPRPDDEDSYGRVDFDDDGGDTVAVIYLARDKETGEYVIHIEMADDLKVVQS